MVWRVGKGILQPFVIACLVLGLLWLHGYGTVTMIQLPVSPGGCRLGVVSFRGVLCVHASSNYPLAEGWSAALRQPQGDDGAYWKEWWDDQFWLGSLLGFSCDQYDVAVKNTLREWVPCTRTNLALPYWLLFMLTAIVPVRQGFVAFRTRRRAISGRCIGCGWTMPAAAHECPACFLATPAAFPL